MPVARSLLAWFVADDMRRLLRRGLNTLASTATHRQTNDSKKLLPFFVGLSIRPLRGLFLAWYVDGRQGSFLSACPHSVARSFLTWCMDGQAREILSACRPLRGLILCSRKRSNKYAVLSGSFALILHLASWTEIDRTQRVVLRRGLLVGKVKITCSIS